MGAFHEEMELIMIWRLGVFDSRPNTMFTHSVLSGAPSTGKSYTPELLERFSVHGSIQRVSHDTDKGYAKGNANF